MIGTGAGKALMQHAIMVKGVTRVDVNEKTQTPVNFMSISVLRLRGVLKRMTMANLSHSCI